jgi:hypothetical protein
MNEIAEKSAYYARISQYAADKVTEFNTIYLGAKTTAPTVDNSGNALIVGALYFNTTDDILYYWDGASWLQEVTINTSQTITGQKTFTQPIVGNVAGNSDTATTLQASRTISISGAVTGTATSFNGSSNITIPTTITSGSTITSPVFAGSATGGIISSVVQGVTDGSTASAGVVGEFLSVNTAATSIASNTTTNGATVTLTAGNWEVFGNSTFNFTGTTVSAGSTIATGISLTTGTLVVDQQQVSLLPAYTTITQAAAFALVTPRVNILVTSSTPVYLVVKSPTISAGSMTFSSAIRARRIR